MKYFRGHTDCLSTYGGLGVKVLTISMLDGVPAQIVCNLRHDNAFRRSPESSVRGSVASCEAALTNDEATPICPPKSPEAALDPS